LRDAILFCTLLLSFFFLLFAKDLGGTMTISTGFLLYVVLYRLTVLAVGALSIYLGFRLFIQSGGDRNRATDTASADIEAGGLKLSLTNFWPGTYFALFGTVLIGLMLWQGTPQLTLKDIRETTETGTKTTNTVEMRSGTDIDLDGASSPAGPKEQAAADREWAKMDKLGLRLSEAAEPLSNIARIWQSEGRIGEAVAMGRLAYLYGPEIDKAAHLALFAELLEKNGNEQEATEARAALAEMQKNADRQGE
jgi:hypothetical protein